MEELVLRGFLPIYFLDSKRIGIFIDILMKSSSKNVSANEGVKKVP